MIARLKVDFATASRPVPLVFVNAGATPTEPCNMFPNDTPGGLGFMASTGQQLILLDGAANPTTGYPLPTDGSFHTVELISTPAGSELRAWPAQGQRPPAPLAVGQSLGPARRVHFGGPNFQNFDYSVDFVRLFERF